MQTFDWPIKPQCTWVKCREQLTCLCTWTDVARSWCLAFKKNMWIKTLQDFYSIQVKSWHLYEATNRKITNFTYLFVLANSAWIRSSFCLQTFTSSALGSSYFLRRFFIPGHKKISQLYTSAGRWSSKLARCLHLVVAKWRAQCTYASWIHTSSKVSLCPP